MALTAVEQHGISVRFACVCLGVSESCYYHQPKLSSENALIADWLLRLTTVNKRWGVGLCFLYLRNVKGFAGNHKRIYRIYCELELNLRIKPKRRIKRDKPDALTVPTALNQVWSMDLSLPSQRVVRSLEQVIEWRGQPAAIRCDNGLPAESIIF